MFGLFSAIVFLPMGILFILVGLGISIYGISQRSEASQRSTTSSLQVEEEKRRVELAASEDSDSEEAYGKLLTYYVYHWGARTGAELLESEIAAYTRRGVSFPEAIKKSINGKKKTFRTFRSKKCFKREFSYDFEC